MTFNEDIDFKILSSMQSFDKYPIPFDDFKVLTQSEDSSYIAEMNVDRKLIKHEELFEIKTSKTLGHFYYITTRGQQYLDYLTEKKNNEAKRFEKENKSFFQTDRILTWTIIAAVAAVTSIIVSIVLYWISQQSS